VEEKEQKKVGYSQKQSGTFQTFVTCDCRGVEITGWIVGDGWSCVGVKSATKFTDIDLTEHEFYDYDEKATQEVSISEVQTRIVRV